MALQQKTGSVGKLYILKIKTKDAADKKVPAYIQVSEKIGDKWTPTANTINSVSGDLTKIEIKKKTWEDEEYNAIGLFFTDKVAKETYLLDTRFNLISQGLFNALLSLESFNDVEIQVYNNKAGYATTSVTQGAKKISWKFNLDELPKVNKMAVGKKKVVDTTELEDFFLSHLSDLALRIEASKGKQKAPEKASPDQNEETEEKDEDIPF